MDLVRAEAVDVLARRLAAFEARIDGLIQVAERLADADARESWEALAALTRTALRAAVPAVEAEPEIIAAWGCPRCGRVEAPQPCLGVCVRLPETVTDASAYRRVATAVERAEALDRVLTDVLVLAGHVRARPGKETETRAMIRERARQALARVRSGRG